MNPLTKYAFKPDYKTVYTSGMTDTEVCIAYDGPTMIISFYGMNSIRDMFFTPPFYVRRFGKWFHFGTWKKLLSVIPFLQSRLHDHNGPVFITGFSMGAAIGIQAIVWIRDKYPHITVSHSLLSPYKSVIGFEGLVHVADKDLFPRWPFFVPGHRNKLEYDSPYRWRDVFKNHFYTRELCGRR